MGPLQGTWRLRNSYGDSCWGRQRTKTFIHCPLVFFPLRERERDRQTDRQTETERLTEKHTEIEKEKRGQREAERDVTEKDWVNMSKKKRYTGFLTSPCNINLPFRAKCVPFDLKIPLGLCVHMDSWNISKSYSWTCIIFCCFNPYVLSVSLLIRQNHETSMLSPMNRDSALAPRGLSKMLITYQTLNTC